MAVVSRKFSVRHRNKGPSFQVPVLYKIPRKVRHIALLTGSTEFFFHHKTEMASPVLLLVWASGSRR